MAKRPAKRKAQTTEPAEHRAVVVGWTHNGLGSSIDLRIQSTPSQQALNAGQIDSHHFLMTHNQALLLAKYLLDTTGQTLPLRAKPSLWRRFLPNRQK
ncbi:MAG: hypothetical protein IPM67_14285 [Sphingomonadales bacterium]|jgi:hypothetical protein|nr:hypothetical protein [Sphingomonadales bacterium]MBK9269787.1 hypothetical protein [Sphingomonadales bacterium]MBP6434035.1 hypothetical protein [Sphingorhabdus sp.]